MGKVSMTGKVVEKALFKARFYNEGMTNIFTQAERRKLRTLVERCIDNYVAHYGVKPTPQEVSDILGISKICAIDFMVNIEKNRELDKIEEDVFHQKI